jgi:ATP-dependent RNA helicase RhlE
MYYKNNKNTNHKNHGSGFSSANPRFNNRFKQKEKQLDHRFFIKKASVSNFDLDYIPQFNFSDFNIDEKLKRNILNHGYVKPTEIQDKSMPEIIQGRDIIGIANTGTGKTAAFLITLINKAFLDRNQRVLILVPTRELAVQIKDEFRIFASGTDLHAVSVIGGENIKKQIYGLNHRPHFVIGTPGRVKDLIERKALNLSLFQNVVLDEVDRMVDIGFIKDIKYIISFLPKLRQSLFFSATVDGKTKEILNSFVNDPVTVSVKKFDTSENIDQDVIMIKDKNEKIDILHDLLAKPGFEKVLVFSKTKWGAEKLSKQLLERRFKVASIHGNKSQNQRQRALRDFKDNSIQVLIATDVASRGLDIDDVTHVINFDAPATYEDYIHRIGRTGRAGKSGIALTFVES